MTTPTPDRWTAETEELATDVLMQGYGRLVHRASVAHDVGRLLAALADAGVLMPVRGEARGHPEDHCRRCGGPNVPWSASSPLWNAVMRGGSINGNEEFHGIVCPTCFAVLAEQRGIADLWLFSARRVHVDLELITPSGRVWDDRTWRWREVTDDPA